MNKKTIISVLIGIAASLSSIPSMSFVDSVVTTAEAAPKKKAPKKPKAPSKPKKSPPVCKTGKRCGNSCIPVTSKCTK